MSRPCYLLPGILGSQLLTAPPLIGGTELWLGVVRLALGEFKQLGLADDGITPHPLHGVQCSPGLPLPEFYGPLVRALIAGLPDREVIPWGYDWRLRIEGVGEVLAGNIRSRASPAEPAEIVAHSQGGLVARCAWRSLVQSGETSLVRRIVSLGTPWHDGSYAAAVLWSGQDPQFVQLYLATAATHILRNPGIDQFGFPSFAGLLSVTATWPAVYELLPPPFVFPASPSDPHRVELYGLANWPPEFGIKGNHLQHAGGAWRLIMNSPSSTPPTNVLTCVAGTGFTTPVALSNPNLLGRPHSLSNITDGDGRVSVVSASGPAGRTIIVQSGHGDMIVHPTVLSEVATWVNEERLPAPPPPPVHLGPRVMPVLAAPIGDKAHPAEDPHDC